MQLSIEISTHGGRFAISFVPASQYPGGSAGKLFATVCGRIRMYFRTHESASQNLPAGRAPIHFLLFKRERASGKAWLAGKNWPQQTLMGFPREGAGWQGLPRLGSFGF